MPTIDVTEKDFLTLAFAANEALVTGNTEEAAELDILARKVNAALSSREEATATTRLHWELVPSVLPAEPTGPRLSP
jgi:hypothetical protein